MEKTSRRCLRKSLIGGTIVLGLDASPRSRATEAGAFFGVPSIAC